MLQRASCWARLIADGRLHSVTVSSHKEPRPLSRHPTMQSFALDPTHRYPSHLACQITYARRAAACTMCMRKPAGIQAQASRVQYSCWPHRATQRTAECNASRPASRELCWWKCDRPTEPTLSSLCRCCQNSINRQGFDEMPWNLIGKAPSCAPVLAPGQSAPDGFVDL